MNDPRFRRLSPGGSIVHEDSAEHAALVMRTLGLDEAAFGALLDEYARRCVSNTVEGRLTALAEAFPRFNPRAFHGASPEVSARCPVCGGKSALAVAVNLRDAEPLRYVRCRDCDHLTLDGAAPPLDIYRSPAYFERQGEDGAGYSGYAKEQAYREEKGRALIGWALATMKAPLGDGEQHRLLEVGSGFGYTRAAAERYFSLRSEGVDVNPAAAAAAQALYGFGTHCGTLAEVQDKGLVKDGQYHLLLYQFVLEHLGDPVTELRKAAHALAPGGHLLLLVPSADAVELAVFGASYRSLRRDHLHLFSRRSLARVLADSGFQQVAVESVCSMHLFRGMLGGAVEKLYATGRGPDLRALARRLP